MDRVRKTVPCSSESEYKGTAWNNVFIVFVCADLLQKLSLRERPLLLRLVAGPEPEQLSFVLKENETEDVQVRKSRHIHRDTKDTNRHKL